MSQKIYHKTHFTFFKQNTCKKNVAGCVCLQATILDNESDLVWK